MVDLALSLLCCSVFQPREDIISETLLWWEGIVIADKPCRSPPDPLELIGVPIGAGDQTEEAYSRIGRAYEPRHEISNNMVCATIKGSDQPAHTRRLIRDFASRLNIL